MSLEVELIIGLSVMFGLAFIFTYLTYQNIVCFLSFSLLFCGFVVWAGLLESWIMSLNLIALITVIFYRIRQYGGGQVS